MNESIDAQLQEAHDENTKLSTIMADMGVSPRPTVSQWLQQKTIQKKSYLQDALINWDRTKEERNTAILLQQAITSQRALKHAAWGAKKDISARIKALREVYDPSTNMSVKPLPSSSVDKMRSTASTKGLKMPTSNKSRRQGHRVAPTSIKERSKVTSPRAKATPTSCKYSNITLLLYPGLCISTALLSISNMLYMHVSALLVICCTKV